MLENITISKEDILEVLENMKTDKTPGLDNVHPNSYTKLRRK